MKTLFLTFVALLALTSSAQAEDKKMSLFNVSDATVKNDSVDCPLKTAKLEGYGLLCSRESGCGNSLDFINSLNSKGHLR